MFFSHSFPICLQVSRQGPVRQGKTRPGSQQLQQRPRQAGQGARPGKQLALKVNRSRGSAGIQSRLGSAGSPQTKPKLVRRAPASRQGTPMMGQ